MRVGVGKSLKTNNRGDNTSVGKHSLNMNLRMITTISSIADKLENNSEAHL